MANAFDIPEQAFEERKTSPIDIQEIMSQAQKYRFRTGVEAPSAAISRITEPAIEAQTREAITGQRAEDIRRGQERGQEFREVAFEEGQEFRETAFEEGLEFKAGAFKEEVGLKERGLKLQERAIQIQEDQDNLNFWSSMLGLGIGIMMFTPLGIPAVVGAGLAGGSAAMVGKEILDL